jgi:cephalosporin hydroxylase
MSNPSQIFLEERKARVASYANSNLARSASEFMRLSTEPKYSYNFSWLSRPIIQYPQDIIAMQELIWEIKPDLIIETGIAHGGSLIMSASMLALIDYCEAVENQQVLDPAQTRRRVLGIDIDIRSHNREAIEAHPMSHRIEMIQGSSIAKDVIDSVYKYSANFRNILVCLDSNHTEEHVLAELEAYAPLASHGSYCCVFDTIIEELPQGTYDRLWDKGDNPRTAVAKYLDALCKHEMVDRNGKKVEFQVDSDMDNKLLISVAPGGYLKRV